MPVPVEGEWRAGDALWAALAFYDEQGYALDTFEGGQAALSGTRGPVRLRVEDSVLWLRAERQTPPAAPPPAAAAPTRGRARGGQLVAPLLFGLALVLLVAAVIAFFTGGRAEAPETSIPPTPLSARTEAASLVRAGILSGLVPPAGGFGLVVFAGGTDEALVAASGCPRETTAFWATDGSGDFVPYVPSAGGGEVNARWRRLFPDGRIPPETAFVGKCR